MLPSTKEWPVLPNHSYNRIVFITTVVSNKKEGRRVNSLSHTLEEKVRCSPLTQKTDGESP